jgi:hypothetical protein
MDEGEARMTRSKPESPDQIAEEITSIRDNIGELVSELDHRRHEALNVGRQIRRHGPLLALGGLAVLGLAAGGILIARQRAKARRRLPARAMRIGQALARIVEHPEREAPPPPSIGRKILTAAGVAAASMLTKRLLQGILASDKRVERQQ